MKKMGGNKHLQQHLLDEAGKANIRYQTLLSEFLQLQKENVSGQRKLRTTNQKRVILLSEVRFLRRKLRFLKKKNNPSIEQPGHVHNQNVNVDSETKNGEPEFCDLVPLPPTNPNVTGVAEGKKEVEIVKKEATQVKISNNYLSETDQLGTHKDESSHNQVPVEV